MARERIAAIYRLNEERLSHHAPGAERQNEAYDAAQAALETALDDMFARAGRELAALPGDAREAKALRSLVNHREGLTVFVERPRTPMDNNVAERLLRGPVIGRRLSFGSDSVTGAKLAALMYSVVGTLNLNGIDVRRWLDAWLAACAENGGRPPDDLAPWVPWSMGEARRRELTVPG
ncbi:MAG: transposase [Defluviicoccus sp.]|nr:transposase [Defluviicoccus sp.]